MKEKRSILFFNRSFKYLTGGAELSTIKLLKNLDEEKYDIYYLSTTKNKNDKKNIRNDFPENWKSIDYKPKFCFTRFFYIEYFLNYKSLESFIKDKDFDEIWVYGLWAPAIAKNFTGKVSYFIRSETDLGINKNYQKGVKKILKNFYRLLELPFYKLHNKHLNCALGKSNIICNSYYMKVLLKKRFNYTSKVIYPEIDLVKLKLSYEKIVKDKNYIVFVGDDNRKGLNLVLEISNLLSGYRFKIYSRKIKNEIQVNNIYWHPWVKDVSLIYGDAILVIVPSQWKEAYGRVANEAFELGIPTLVSNTGGLPEAVNRQIKNIVINFKSAKSWVKAIKTILKDN